MRRFSRYDSDDRPLLRPNSQILTEQNLYVPAADRLNVEEAVVVDVLHHQADLVAVAGKHDARLAARMHDGHDIAVAVGADLVRVFSCPGSDHVLNRPFETGRTRSLKKLVEERQGTFLHECPLLYRNGFSLFSR